MDRVPLDLSYPATAWSPAESAYSTFWPEVYVHARAKIVCEMLICWHHSFTHIDYPESTCYAFEKYNYMTVHDSELYWVVL